MARARLYAAGMLSAAVALLGAAPSALAQSNTVSTVAGTTAGFSGDTGPATSAQLNLPIGVSVTPDGGFLIADQANARVRRVFPDGTIVTIAGSGNVGSGGDGGPAVQAELSSAINAAVMRPDGSVLIADSNNHRVRLVTPSGEMQTAVGNGSATYSGDNGPAASATVNFPADIALMPDGGYLIADNDNHRIRRVLPDETITTAAGTGTPAFGGDEGPATSAQINDPTGVASTGDGGFVIGDTNNNRVRRVAPDGTITTIAGNGAPTFAGDGGPATLASLNKPNGVAIAPDGGVLVADRLNHRIRRIAPDGTISTVAGTGTANFNGDGLLGPATDLNGPFDVAVNAEGDYLIADTFNNRIRLLDVAAPPPPPPPPRLPIPATLTLGPTRAERTPGDANVVTATARNDDRSPVTNRTIGWSVTGANPGKGTVTTDANGVARISWEGVHEGPDELIAFVDTDGDGTSGPAEPNASATVVWTLPTPAQGRTFNIEPVSGVVKIRVLRRAGRVHSAGSSFTPLEEAQQVPISTEVDVTKGRVRMTLAADRRGNIQKGEFYGGVYTTTQPRTGTRPISELRLSEPLTCRPNTRNRLSASRGRSRRLWGNGRGRFRTRGRYATATVRGTIWLTKDTCNATTTTVRQGTVVVRDLAKRKNVVVKRGRSYTARRKRR